jgi:SAM-dependent methyltransferase
MRSPVTSVQSGNYRDRERAHFDTLAERQGEVWWGHQTPAAPLRLRRRSTFVRDALIERDCPRVFEVGCGGGIFTADLLEIMPHIDIVAVDISPKSVELAKKRCAGYANVRFEVGDASAGRIEGGGYDAVIGNSVLHHIPPEDLLPTALDLLKPGGLFLFCEPNMMNPQVAAERNIRPIGKMLQNSEDETAFFRWRLKSRLEQAGFEHVRIMPFDFLHPASPRSVLRVAEKLGRALERLPIVKEIAGSLWITARKPATA